MYQERKRAVRPSSKNDKRGKLERAHSMSAWALASPRFGERKQQEIRSPRGSNLNTSRSIHDDSDLDLSGELLLSPSKAKKLLASLFDDGSLVNSKSSSSHDSNGSLVSFQTESYNSTYKNTRDTSTQDKIGDPNHGRSFLKDCDREERYIDIQSGRRYNNEKTECVLEKLPEKVEINAKDAKIRKLEKEKDGRREPQEDIDTVHRFSQLLRHFGVSGKDLEYAFATEENEKTDRMKDAHDKEVLRLKEEHKQDIIDLLCSRVDVVRQQGNTILQLKYELDSIRREYVELKDSSMKVFDEATQAVATNCSTLKSYVQEEIRDTDTQTKDSIEKLKMELQCAYEQMASIARSPSKCNLPEPSTSSLESSALPHQDDECLNANNRLNEDDGGTWLELKGQFLEAIEGNMNVCDATSVVSKLVYDTCTGDKLFKDICYKKVEPRKRSSKPDYAYFEYGDKDGQMNEEDEFLDALS
jgi:hypothetical protein